jgi:DnaA-homolog protein
VSGSKAVQLPLGIALRDGPSLDNFEVGNGDESWRATGAVVDGTFTRSLYLWGAKGTGKTHLLEACCRGAAQAQRRVAYLPLGAAGDLPVGALEGLEQLDVLCLDDVHAVAGLPAWEEALFHLYNRAEQTGAVLVFAAVAPPAGTGYLLPDLATRLASGLVIRLQPLDDAGRARALKRRARERGLELSDEVSTYLMRRCPRDMHSLFALLDRLDRSSLVAQRRLTVPFVRELLRGG